MLQLLACLLGASVGFKLLLESFDPAGMLSGCGGDFLARGGQRFLVGEPVLTALQFLRAGLECFVAGVRHLLTQLLEFLPHLAHGAGLGCLANLGQ